MSTQDAWQPHVVVAAIVERDGRYLMVEEMIAGQRRINQPAGHWERGETLLEAVHRETLEEAAWEIEVTGFLGVYTWQPAALPYPFVRFAFIARALQEQIGRPLDQGILRALWMTPDELQARADELRSPSVLQCIADHRAGRVFPLDLIQQQIEPIPTA
jgi:ADP-ribose pyrophosphatase YjhB (NUDIX family)